MAEWQVNVHSSVVCLDRSASRKNIGRISANRLVTVTSCIQYVWVSSRGSVCMTHVTSMLSCALHSIRPYITSPPTSTNHNKLISILFIIPLLFRFKIFIQLLWCILSITVSRYILNQNWYNVFFWFSFWIGTKYFFFKCTTIVKKIFLNCYCYSRWL